MSQTNQIAKIRKQRGLSQQQLADKLGIHWITLSKLERGKQRLTVEWLDKIAGVLEVGRWVLLGGTESLIDIQIHGQLNADGHITTIDSDLPTSRQIYRWTLNNPDAIWVIVGQVGFSPLFQRGDLLEFFEAKVDPVNYIGKLCYVRSKQKRSYFGLLARGKTASVFDVIVAGQSTIHDVEVDSLAQLTLAMFQQPDAVYGIEDDFFSAFP